jgi:glycine dehydrogenase subunit 1
MSYISLSDKDKKEMLARAGAASVGELFGCLPKDLRLKRPLAVPPGLSEPELIGLFEEVGRRSTRDRYLSFLGAGAYPHLIPCAVDALSSRGEFVTPYTPYQPEVSQGTLQAIFEYQTLICQLTGLDTSDASLYDGASAAAEAVLMAHRLNDRPRVLVARSLHPQYRQTIRTYCRNLSLSPEEVGFDDRGEVSAAELESRLDGATSAVVCQSPNFFGQVEDLDRLAELAHAHGALLIVVVTEALSLGILEAPGKLGADIVTGEAQSFGLPLSFGGPYLGFMSCRRDFVRQMPGRIAGEARDVDGRRGFVLTLATREQHIRREKATSNICTNQALCALRATIFLETLGHDGLRELAVQNIHKARYARSELSKVRGVKVKFDGRPFNEFVLEFSRDWKAVDAALLGKGIIGGLGLERDYPELGRAALVCVTETHRREDIDRLAAALKEALS